MNAKGSNIFFLLPYARNSFLGVLQMQIVPLPRMQAG